MRSAEPTTPSAQHYHDEPLFIANSRRLLARIALINDTVPPTKSLCQRKSTLGRAAISADEKINDITLTFR
jgi:hypothetical protein